MFFLYSYSWYIFHIHLFLYSYSWYIFHIHVFFYIHIHGIFFVFMYLFIHIHVISLYLYSCCFSYSWLLIHIHGLLIHIHGLLIHIHRFLFIFMVAYSYSWFWKMSWMFKKNHSWLLIHIYSFDNCPGFSKRSFHLFWKRQLILVCGTHLQDLHSSDLADCIKVTRDRINLGPVHVRIWLDRFLSVHKRVVQNWTHIVPVPGGHVWTQGLSGPNLGPVPNLSSPV